MALPLGVPANIKEATSPLRSAPASALDATWVHRVGQPVDLVLVELDPVDHHHEFVFLGHLNSPLLRRAQEWA
jgi:hypothetical protein